MYYDSKGVEGETDIVDDNSGLCEYSGKEWFFLTN
jgi:hypothetical protein